MININQDKLEQVAQEALARVAGNYRWQNAIQKALAQLESNPYMHFDGEALLMLSPSGEIYRANGACQCKAYHSGQPCWHRAAARLIKRYNETTR